MNSVMIPLFYGVKGPGSFSAFSWAGSLALWPSSSGGKAMECSVGAGTPWCSQGQLGHAQAVWLLTGIAALKNSLFLVGFCQVAATSDNALLLLLLLLTTYPSWRSCHHFHSVWWVLHSRCSSGLITKLWPCPLGLAEIYMPTPRSTNLICGNCWALLQDSLHNLTASFTFSLFQNFLPIAHQNSTGLGHLRDKCQGKAWGNSQREAREHCGQRRSWHHDIRANDRKIKHLFSLMKD